MPDWPQKGGAKHDLEISRYNGPIDRLDVARIGSRGRRRRKRLRWSGIKFGNGRNWSVIKYGNRHRRHRSRYPIERHGRHARQGPGRPAVECGESRPAAKRRGDERNEYSTFATG